MKYFNLCFKVSLGYIWITSTAEHFLLNHLDYLSGSVSLNHKFNKLPIDKHETVDYDFFF